MTEQKSNPRRAFLKSMAAGAGAAVVLSKVDSAFAKDKAKKVKFVKESDPLPKGLGYIEDATKAKRTDKAGTKAAEQTCANCQFYTKGGMDGKAEYGKCQLFPSGMVKGKAWCKSWIKKA